MFRIYLIFGIPVSLGIMHEIKNEIAIAKYWIIIWMVKTEKNTLHTILSIIKK